MTASGECRIGFIGAGYIASRHAEAIRATPGARLVAVCDSAIGSASDLAQACGAQALGSLDDLIASGLCDAVHVLTPPSSHRDIAIRCLQAGLHVLVEKPVAVSAAEVKHMRDAARENGRIIAASHNFLGLPGYERLKKLVARGELGRLSSLQVDWALPLAPLRSGPFGLWLLREPRNLLLELGPHLYAFAVDLLGVPEILHLELGQPVELAGGGTRHQSWRILARVGQVDVAFNIALVEVKTDKCVTVRGSSGVARLDFDTDVLVVGTDNTSDLVLNPLRSQLSMAGQHLREGLVNAGRQLTSLNRKSPYGLSFRTVVGAFVRTVRGEVALDPRFGLDTALSVMQAIDTTLERLPPGRRPSGRRRVRHCPP